MRIVKSERCGRLLLAVVGFALLMLMMTNLVLAGSEDPLGAVAANGPLVVTDSANNRVLVFRPPYRKAQPAWLVLGQANFTSAVSAATQNVTGGQPVSAVMDKHGAVWVTDQNNNRVLRFSPPFRNGESASLVLGQPDFSSASPNLSASGLRMPTYLAFDPGGNLWVSDRDNCRVVEYQPPFSNGMNASLVIGQQDFTHTTTNCANALPCIPSQTQTCNTEGVTFDALGNLWLTDRRANRVLEFAPPFSTGMQAAVVIGQNDFVSAASQTSQSGFNSPNGITFLNGNLWVADTLNHRTLEFEPPFTNAMSASVVLGQPDFSTRSCNTTRNGECWAFGVAADHRGNLWLADFGNCRVLRYEPDVRELFTTNQNAKAVLGEPDFTTAGCATTRRRVNQPQGISIAGTP
jgi:sugar lactone lactonase YvrE